MSAHDDYLDPDRHDPALQDDDGDSQAMAVLTLRDYFAARAMQGFICEPVEDVTCGSFAGDCSLLARDIARASYVFADAMLEARNA